ncbi:MAG: glucokinase [Pseudomonadota bacterium]|nr:glucokinase [Pseudomonadota bacterium]
MTTFDIVADIGGTNARFACAADGSNELQHIETLKCAAYAGIEEAFRAYVRKLPAGTVNTLCLAIAGPVEQDAIRFTNNAWAFSRSELARALDCRVITINDFTAQASALDVLRPDELEWLGAARPRGGRARVVMGPGTGLGVAALSPDGAVLPTEGGHIGFAPTNSHELRVLELLWKQFPRVSIERLLSGPGLRTLHEANMVLAGEPAEALSASDITERAHQGDARCAQTVQNFLEILATVAGDYVLALGALDGVYLTGGILPKLGDLLDRERFRARFEAKGRFQAYCARAPLALMRAEHTGLRGCLAALRRIDAGAATAT